MPSTNERGGKGPLSVITTTITQQQEKIVIIFLIFRFKQK